MKTLGKGIYRIKNLLHSDDTQVMMNALMDLKVRMNEPHRFSLAHFKTKYRVPPLGGQRRNTWGKRRGRQTHRTSKRQRAVSRECGDRIPVVRSYEESGVAITGNARMKQSPVGPLVEALGRI